MTEELGYLGCFKDELLDVAILIVSKGLYDLRDIKEGQVDRVVF